MENLILVLHLLTALAIIGLILLQQGKGAEMGASFGSGASQTLFGSTGSGNFFAKVTAVLATVFLVTSFSLAVIAKQQTSIDDDIPLPVLEAVNEATPAVEESDIPTLDAGDGASTEEDIPEVPVD